MSKVIDFVDEKIIENSHSFRINFGRSRFRSLIKRAFDIFGAFLGLFFLSPLFLYVSIKIKRDSPGPVFFRGPRAGLNGKIFNILKFRTMYEEPESYNGSKLTARNDKRITPFGAWLRDTKLNELPQLWNVLVGEMSFVGPRPEDPEIAAQWPEDLRTEVLSIRPGVTSPASVTFRDEQQLLSSDNAMDNYLRSILPEKLRLDQLYVRHHNFIGDLDVIFMTLTMLLPGLRSKKVAETALFEGPLTNFFRRYISWFVIDTLVAFFAISLAVLIARIHAPLNLGFGKAVAVAIALALGMAVSNTVFGLKNLSWRYASPMHVIDIAFSTTLAMVIFVLLWNINPSLKLPVFLLVDFGIFSFSGFVIVRYRERLVTGLASRWIRWRSQSSVLGERVLVIGAGDASQLAIWLLEKSNLSSAFSIIGMVDDDFRKVNQRVNGYPVLGTTNDLPEIVAKKSIGLIMFAITKVSENDRARILAKCQGLPVRILMIPDLLNVLTNYFKNQTLEVIRD